MRWRTERAILFLIAVACSTVAIACNVPVFRYALDHWRPDEYRAVILHDGPLNEESKALLTELQRTVSQQQLNLTVQQIDVHAVPPAELPAAVASLNLSAGPQVMVHYPRDLKIAEPIVSSPLSQLNLEQLIDSPLRRELLRRLADGQSAVWLLVGSGDAAADQAARNVLEQELQVLQSTLELPKLTDDPDDAIVGGPALRIEFSILELAKDDASEWALRNMLIGSEPDLKELSEPMLFPVFGCGRALWPLVGAGISPDNLRESATFVAGACSCQVKEQNPGFDLLVKANWNELLPWTESLKENPNFGKNVSVAQTIPIPKGAQMTNELIAMKTGTATTQASPPAPKPAEAQGPSVLMVALILGLLIGIALLFATRSKRPRAEEPVA